MARDWPCKASQPWVQDHASDRNTIREVSHEDQSIKILQLSTAALVLSAFAYGGVCAAEKKKAAAEAAGLRPIKAEADCTPRATTAPGVTR